MHMRLVAAPSKPEERDDDHRTAGERRRKSLFGRMPAFALDISQVELLIPERDRDCAAWCQSK
ncbi:hypothetical protein BJY59DRAFT_688353 [Rhodotorula toruloides]